MMPAVGTLRAHIVAKEVQQALMRSTTSTDVTWVPNCDVFDGPRRSVPGYKQTSSRPKSMSALPPTADILDKAGNVSS